MTIIDRNFPCMVSWTTLAMVLYEHMFLIISKYLYLLYRSRNDKLSYDDLQAAFQWTENQKGEKATPVKVYLRFGTSVAPLGNCDRIVVAKAGLDHQPPLLHQFHSTPPSPPILTYQSIPQTTPSIAHPTYQINTCLQIQTTCTKPWGSQ